MPVARPGVPPPAEPGESGPPPRAPRDPHTWRRLTRTRRGAVGLGIVAAALLLWPFAGWFWIPWLAGLAVLVLVGLLRLDRLLGGWSWHVGGLAVVAGLMLRTGPWDWALAAALGVLLAGLVQLPWWRLAAVGAVLCVLAGVGWGVDRYRDAQEEAAQEAQTRARTVGSSAWSRAESRPAGGARRRRSQAMSARCATACWPSRRGHRSRRRSERPTARPRCDRWPTRVDDAAMYARGRAPSAAAGDGLTVDACRITWATGAVPGPQLGVLTVGRAGTETTYVVTAFRPCPA